MDTKGISSLSPVTPDSNKENADLMSTLASPLTLISPPHQSSDNSYMNEDDDSPCTPKEGVFDPFAPGPDKLMMAPCCMKYLKESRSFVSRRLNFTSLVTKNDYERVPENEFDDDDDDFLLEAVYESLLEAIISKQAEDMLGLDGAETPPFAPRLTGIAETCPGAPLKAVRKSRNIELGLCRKLEFDF